MLRIQRALLGEILVMLLFVGGITTGVVFSGFVLYVVTEGEGLAIDLLADLTPNLLPVSLSYSIPFAWLACVVLVVGRMQAENEVTALKTAGLHLRSLVYPVLGLAAVLALVLVPMNAELVPQAQRRVRSGLRKFVAVFLNSLQGAEKTVVLGDGRLSYAGYDAADGSFRDVEMDRRLADGSLQQKIVARRVRIQRLLGPDATDGQLEFSFRDAHVIEASGLGGLDVRRQAPTTRLQVGWVERLGASTLFNESFGMPRSLGRPKEMTASELLYAMERRDVWRADPTDAAVWLHARLSLGCSPVALALFALGMSLLLPPGGRRVRDFLLAFLPAVLSYFPLLIAGPSLVRAGLAPWLGLWAPNLLVGAAGLVLLGLAYRR